MQWKLLEIGDKKEIEKFIKNRFVISDFSFTNLIIWSQGENTQYSINEDILYLKGVYENEEYYYMPIPLDEQEKTLENWKKGIEKILKNGKKIGFIPEYWAKLLENDFEVVENRASFDYIYSSQDLGTLKGRKYSKKKNKINNFNKNYDYKYERITKDNIKEVIKYQEEWCKTRECFEKDILRNEHLGILNLLNNFDDLDYVGAMIKVDDKVIAYTLGEIVSEDYVVVHTEKADSNYIGSYQMINHLFVKNEFMNYKFINREDDFGDEGLREAKESYHPVEFLKKYEIKSQE